MSADKMGDFQLSAQAMEKHAASLDESLLANAYAWMRKAADDKLDGRLVVFHLQKPFA